MDLRIVGPWRGQRRGEGGRLHLQERAEQPGPAVSVGGISDAAKHRHAREEKLRRHLASEQPRIGLFDHGMVWGVGSDDPSSETEAEQCDLVADDVRHDPVPAPSPAKIARFAQVGQTNSTGVPGRQGCRVRRKHDGQCTQNVDDWGPR